ncbi:MAG TPA: tripartite tricarboxylate transporter substrate binding protein [Burkholderiales bacterium]|nr:tripartite tricarboxylate transporter substrate binding protein [Burkholderiales bacterium]
MKRSLICAVALAVSAAAHAAEPAFPDRAVRLIVPFPPGGVNDIVSRLVANRLNAQWGKPVIVDNRGGANGTIAGEIAAKANPDGYTLFIVSSSIASNVALYSKLPFDLTRDFAPVSALVTGAYALVVNPSVPAPTVQELIKLAKAQPRKLNFSSFGQGSSAHLVAELFQRMAGVEMVHVPYKGGAPAMAAVVAGEVQMTFSNLSVALPQVKAGKLKALAVSSAKRQPALPGVPALDESGLKGFDATAWVGLLAPAQVRRPLIAQVNRDVRTVLGDAEVLRSIESHGLEPWPGTPEELARHMRVEIERWGKVIRDAGVKLES